MVPRVAGKGKSFSGAGLYYLHDKNAATSERVAFTHTENLPTDDARRALRIMARTAMNQNALKEASGGSRAGRKLAKSVYTYSLSWSPDERPERPEMIEAGRETLAALGLSEHEAVLVAHRDEAHPHLHVIVNRVHPVTGKAAGLSKDHLTLSRWAEAYEKRQGRIRCEQRARNNAARRSGRMVRDRRQRLAGEAQKRRRAALGAQLHKREAEARNLEATHKGERAALDEAKTARLKEAAAREEERARKEWAAVYRAQRAARQRFERTQGAALARFRYWLKEGKKQGGRERKTGARLAAALDALRGGPGQARELAARQRAERVELAAAQRERARAQGARIETADRAALAKLRAQQRPERQAQERSHSAQSQQAARAVRQRSGRSAREEFGQAGRADPEQGHPRRVQREPPRTPTARQAEKPGGAREPFGRAAEVRKAGNDNAPDTRAEFERKVRENIEKAKRRRAQERQRGGGREREP